MVSPVAEISGGRSWTANGKTFGASETAVLSDPSPVVLPRTEQWTGGTDREPYRIFLGAPDSPPPPQGYPLLVVLDANATFATAYDSMRIQSRRSERTAVDPTVVLGIGYPTDAPHDVVRRVADFTTRTGGVSALQDLIDRDIRPGIETRFPIDPERRALFGHSLGGLFVLQTMFSRATRFRTFIAASPSIWWDDCAVLRDERIFSAMHAGCAGRPRLLVTVGGHEGEAGLRQEGADPSRRVHIRTKRMIDNAREMVSRLRDLPMDANFVEFPEENHASVLPGSIARALRFAAC